MPSMCLFKVFLEDNGERKLVAEKIAVLEARDGKIYLYNDVLECKNVIEGAMISSVNTISEIVVLKKT